VLILAVALNLEPNRLGIIGLLLLRPHPIRQLLVFLSTSFLTNSIAGLVVHMMGNITAAGRSGFAAVVCAVPILLYRRRILH